MMRNASQYSQLHNSTDSCFNIMCFAPDSEFCWRHENMTDHHKYASLTHTHTHTHTHNLYFITVADHRGLKKC